MVVFDLLSMLGGLALFLFGMTYLSESLEKSAGSKLKPVLENLTSTPIKGVLLGTGVAAVIQSSSATTVMSIGFVNSGVMKLRQAIYVVMGANIGTTITAWILSLSGISSNNFWISLLKPTNFTPILATIGIILLLTNKRKAGVAGILLGFSFLMFGMDMMSDAAQGISVLPWFRELLVAFSNPIVGVLTGALVTALLQSSSASVGILQAFANAGALTYGAAIPVIMGQNIGTCITAILTSIGANRNAKRVAAVHLSFNIIGTAVWLVLYYGLNSIFRFGLTDRPISAFNIAVIHTIFNVTSTLLLFPFARQLEKLATRLVPDSKEEEKFEILDDRLLKTPSIAIEQCRRLTVEMANLSADAYRQSVTLLTDFQASVADRVYVIEDKVDAYEDRIGSYLVEVSLQSLSEVDSREVSKLLFLIGDFERISDHACNIAHVAEEIHDKRLYFSPHAEKEIGVLTAAVGEIMDLGAQVFETDDLEVAEYVEPLEQTIDNLCSTVKANHVKRLRDKQCTIEMGFILQDLLNNLERTADHCSNIAVTIIEIERLGVLDAHAYSKSLQTGPSARRFFELMDRYMDRYQIPGSKDRQKAEDCEPVEFLIETPAPALPLDRMR